MDKDIKEDVKEYNDDVEIDIPQNGNLYFLFRDNSTHCHRTTTI